MSIPRRIQRSRKKGYRLADLSDNYVCCTRPGRWANPYPWHSEWAMWAGARLGVKNSLQNRKRAAAMAYLRHVTLGMPPNLHPDGERFPGPLPRAVWDWRFPSIEQIRAELGGRDLACWCGPDDWCHVDVLLAVANPDEDFTGQPGPMLALMMEVRARKMDPGLRRGDGDGA